MPARFGFGGESYKDPEKVIERLASSGQDDLGSLIIPGTRSVCLQGQDGTLFMSGTANELLGASMSAMRRGIASIFIYREPHQRFDIDAGIMSICYVLRPTGSEPLNIIGIGPRSYWGTQPSEWSAIWTGGRDAIASGSILLEDLFRLITKIDGNQKAISTKYEERQLASAVVTGKLRAVTDDAKQIVDYLEKDVAWAARVLKAGHLQAALDTGSLQKLLARRIGERAGSESESRYKIKAILTAFVANGGNMAIASDLRTHFETPPLPDLDSLRDAFRLAHPPNLIGDRVALLKDLNSNKLSPLPALARHGLVPVDLTPWYQTSKAIVATEPDVTAFTYAKILGRSKIFGNRVSMSHGAFYFINSYDLNEFEETHDKAHVSIDHDGVNIERAWNAIFPILIRNVETIKQFKITDMKDAKPLVDKGQEKVKRVYFGSQITIYQHGKRGSKADSRAFAEVMRDVESALQSADIKEGERPDSDVWFSHSFFISFRRDLKDDGQELRPEDPEYERYRAAFRGRPLCRALDAVLG